MMRKARDKKNQRGRREEDRKTGSCGGVRSGYNVLYYMSRRWLEVTASSRAPVAVGWGRTLEDKLTTLIGSSRGVNRVYSVQVREKIERGLKQPCRAHAGYPISEIVVRPLLVYVQYR
jgi:hypothetical protein